MPLFRVSSGRDVRIVTWRGVLTVGRGGRNSLVLRSVRVSRRHARVWEEGDAYLIEDLGSHNGTYLERGHEVVPITSPQQLHAGDVVRIGPAHLIFEPTSATAPPPIEPPTTHALQASQGGVSVGPEPFTQGLQETKIGRVVPLLGSLPLAALPSATATGPAAEAPTLAAARSRIWELEQRIAELELALATANGSGQQARSLE